jgi:peptidoglycan/LPS O-acetylase OafA/YrhL
LLLSRNEISRTSVPTIAQRNRFIVLDSWRGICALGVAIFHLDLAGPGMLAAPIRGYLFVDFFFVLSGFVISAAYGDRISERGEFVRFILRRFGRIYPVHFAVLMACASVVAFTLLAAPPRASGEPLISADATSLSSLVTNLLLLHSMGFCDQLTWNRPSWSISVEFYTYAVFGAASLVAGRHLWRATIPTLILCALFTVSQTSNINVSCDFGFLRSLLGFFSGHLVHRLWQRHPLAPSFASRILAELTAVAAIVAFFAFAGEGRLTWLAPLIFSTAIYVFAHEGGVVSIVLRRRAFIFLGTLSYTLYMVHYPLYRGMDLISRTIKIPSLPPPAMSALALGAAVAAALVLHLCIERPGMRLFSGWADRARFALSGR